jgi:multidrug transporter EmrE-like cation transporter
MARAASDTPSAKLRASRMAWLYVAATVSLTVYGQLVVKWQVSRRGHLPADLHGKVSFLAGLITDPWVLSALLGAFVAALSWMLAVSQLELSRAYPFVGLSFAFVLMLSAVFFGEALTVAKVAGVGLVIAGIAVGAGL